MVVDTVKDSPFNSARHQSGPEKCRSNRTHSSRRGSMPGRWCHSIDPVAVARGASASFTVFIVGMLATPLAFKFGTEAGLVYPFVVTVAASSLAAVKASIGCRATVQSLAAAVCGYALLFPLMLTGFIRIEFTFLAGIGVTAVVSSAAAACVHARLSRSEGHE